MADLIKDEVITEEKSKEQKALELFNELENKKLQKKAALLYKFDLYDKKQIDSFDENAYTDVTYKNGYKGYALFKDSEGKLIFVKELSAEAGEDTYGFEVLELANLDDSQMHQLHMHANRHPIGMYVLIGGMVLGLLLAAVVFFVLFFDSVSGGFTTALTYAYFYAGGYLTVGLGILGLLLQSLKGRKCHKGHKH